MRKQLAAVVAVVGLMLMLPGTVSADAELGHTGQVGQHSLRDDAAHPGAWCTYEEVPPPPDEDWAGKLTYIEVRKPRVNAISGTQRVGWRFIVQRTELVAPSAPWVTTYKSPVQRANATVTTIAPFTNMGIKVNLPADSSAEDPGYTYRVRVKMFWYRDDGTTKGTAVHQVEEYATVESFYGGWFTEEDCRAYKIGLPVF